MICVSIGKSNLNDLIKIIQNNDLVEIRLDLLKPDFEEFERILEYREKLIITYRLNGNDEAIACKYIENSILKGVKYVDIDLLDSDKYLKELKLIGSSETELIMSFHEYDFTPENYYIDELLERMSSFNPSIYKLCFNACSVDDVIRTMMLYEKYPKNKLLAFNLGEIGRLSRLIAIKIGAPYMYASLDNIHKTENSQLTMRELESLLNIIGL